MSGAGSIKAAQEALAGGKLVIVPTQTVFGLAADAHSGAAVARLYALKQRPAQQPVSLLVAGEVMAARYGILGERAKALAAHFWPGPLTLVVPLRPGAPLCAAVSGGGQSIGLRVPEHEQTRALIARFGRALATSSANRTGAPAPTSLAALSPEIVHGAALRLCGEQGRAGASTVVAIAPERITILRAGALSADKMEAVLAPFGAKGKLA